MLKVHFINFYCAVMPVYRHSDRCYHTMARDLSARPHEILSLKIKDIVFKTAGNKQYAEVLVNCKTGLRNTPLIQSIPYVKDGYQIILVETIQSLLFL